MYSPGLTQATLPVWVTTTEHFLSSHKDRRKGETLMKDRNGVHACSLLEIQNEEGLDGDLDYKQSVGSDVVTTA